MSVQGLGFLTFSNMMISLDFKVELNQFASP